MAGIITRNMAEALIPVEESREIIQGAVSSSYAMRLMRRLPNMSARQRRIPVLQSMAQAYFVGGDTGLKKTTEQAWESKYLNVEEIAAIVPIPEAVLSDSSFDIWGEVRPRLIEAIGQRFDAAVFFSVAKPDTWPEGLVTQAIAAGKTVAEGTGVDIGADVSEAMSVVEAQGYRSAGIASDVSALGTLRNLRDANNQPIYSPSLLATTPSTLWGTPIEFVENGSWDYSKALMLLGAWTNAVYSIRQDITFKVLDQAVISDDAGAIIYNLAQQDMVALRVVMRAAWQVASPINRMNENTPEAQRFPLTVITPKVGP